MSPQSQSPSRIRETLDAASGFAFLGIVAEVIPVVLGVAAILWYGLRFANWYRVNYQDKEPWKGM